MKIKLTGKNTGTVSWFRLDQFGVPGIVCSEARATDFKDKELAEEHRKFLLTGMLHETHEIEVTDDD